MKKAIRLSIFWITTLLCVSELSGQISFVDPPGNITATCETFDLSPPDPMAVDDCGGNIFITFSDLSTRVNSLDTCAFYQYSVTRTFTATNNCSDTATYIQIIAVIDGTPPVFSAPPSVTVNCSDLEDLSITGGIPQFVDECGGPVISTYEDIYSSASCGDPLTRIWTVTDMCGNASKDTQMIMVIDDTAPFFVLSPRDISVMCSMTENPYPIFNDWVEKLAYSTYEDACSEVDYFFAAVPGSYDIADAATFPGEHPGGLNAPECRAVLGSVQFESVDFVIVDICGNAYAEQSTFHYVDDVVPVLGDCDFDITVDLAGADCTQSLSFDIPAASDSCALDTLEFIFSDIQSISSAAQGDSTVIVSDLTFNLNGYGPEFVFEGEQFFEVQLSNVDAEGSNEFFKIFDENDRQIGTTPVVSQQCGSTSFLLGPIAPDTMRKWSADGEVSFTFSANTDVVTPSNSINDLCSGGSVGITQKLTINRTIEPVQLYFQVDDGAEIPIDGDSVMEDLNAGIHIVRFTAKDCADNSTACFQRVTVFDSRPPQLNCAANMALKSTEEFCEVPVMISEIAMINNPCAENIMVDIMIDGAMNSEFSGSYEAIKDSTLFYPLGRSTITVVARDFSDNEAQCTFVVDVEDNIFPEANCETINIPVAAVELSYFQVTPADLAGTSTDNCGIKNIIVQNNRFTCADLGMVVTRPVLVVDNSDNISACEGTFNISDAPLPLSYTAGICPEDSLILFLGIPLRDEYVYDWDGPLGFSSVLGEPFIPTVSVVHEGEYFVTVTNTLTGCESRGRIDVLIDDVKKPELTTEAIGCTAIPHRITSTKIEGDVNYFWYDYSGDGRDLLGVTAEPFIDVDFEPGDYEVGLTVNNDRCESLGSNRENIEIRGQPEGAICTALFQGCVGEPLELCAKDPEGDYSIRWFGPNNFTSSADNPVVTDSFTSAFAGVYKLVIEVDQCITDTLTTTVLSNVTPPRPEILGDIRYCAGEDIELASSEIKNGYIYVWNSPSGIIRNNQPILRIPEAGSQFVGQWTLSIEDGPCSSKPSAPVNLEIEARFDFSIAPVATQCEGAKVKFITNGAPESQFAWTGPNGFTSSLFSPNVDVAEGFYAVEATSINGCTYTDDVFVNTVIIPQVRGVDVNMEGTCIDSEETLTIIPILSIPADVQFEWIGPNITSASSSLSIDNFSAADNGIYSMKVFNGDCESEVFDFILNFTISPKKPTIDADPIACIGDPLSIETEDYGESAVYFWNTPQGMVETTENRLFFERADVEVSGSYEVQVSIGECTSAVSAITMISVSENTFVPQISASGNECLMSEYKLFTDLDEGLEIEWELPNGSFVITDTLELSLEENDAGNYRARSLSNGCPSVWSAIENIDVLDPRNGISLTTDFLFSCNNNDSGLEFCVDASGPTTGITFQWFLGEQLLGQTNSLCYEVESPEFFAFGQNIISLRFKYNGCIIPFDESLVLDIENVRDISISAGNLQLFCIGDELMMNADEVSTSELSAFWSVDDGVVVDDIRDPMALITVLEDVDSTFAVWNVEHIECGVVYRDSVVLKQKVKPLPIPDTISLDGDAVSILPLENDVLIDGNTYRISEVSKPRWGSASISGEEIAFTADRKYIGGEITFSYTVCDDACVELCNEGEVVVYYNTASCKGNNVLTPNNDGANDRFMIPCVEEENLPENSLVILNEIGNTIYEQSPYDNSWNGTFNGEPLPEGTYYYIFRKNNEASVVQGFISIER